MEIAAVAREPRTIAKYGEKYRPWHAESRTIVKYSDGHRPWHVEPRNVDSTIITIGIIGRGMWSHGLCYE